MSEEKKELPEEAKEEKAEEAKAEETPEEVKEESPEPKPEKSSSNESAQIEQLKETVKLIAEKLDRVYDLAKDSKEELAEASRELKETTGLLQTVIGDQDAQAAALATITASLVKLHKEQAAKK